MSSDPSTSMFLGSSDDLALVQRILDRRQEALAELYDRYAPLLLAVTVEVTVEAERGYPGGPKVTVTAAEMVFVHVGQDGRPLPIPARS